MSVEIISVLDLPESVQAHELVGALVAGANARAARVAPCLAGTGADAPTEDQLAEARMVLIGAVKRWADAGSGAFTQQTAGPYNVSMDTRQRSGYNLWPSEIKDLQAICSSGATGREAFSIDTAPAGTSAHLPWCNLAFGAGYCSCGADIAGQPIYELG